MDVIEQEITGKPVVVLIAGKEYTLAYPLSAVILYKQKTGDNLFVAGTWKKIAPAEDPERFRACLWAGLQEHHPDVSIDFVGSKVDFRNAADLTAKIAEALAAYFPKRKEADPNEQRPENPAEN